MKTVRELKAFLATLPEDHLDLRVDLEGCDCDGAWGGLGDITEKTDWSTKDLKDIPVFTLRRAAQ